MKINLPLLALAIGAFAIGTTEFSPMGLLPNIAHDLGISIPTAGMLITGYALGVMIGAPIMTLWFGHFPRRKALIILMAIFTLGNLIAAIAPNYLSLMGARVITSLNHGAFFGIGSIVATSVVPKDKQASAFAGIAVLGVITMLSLFKALPQGSVGQKPDVMQELKVLTRPAVMLALLTTVMGAGILFTLYTYIAPTLSTITHASPTFVTCMLVLVGLGFSIGNHYGGKFSDQSIDRTLIGFLVVLIVLMGLFPILAKTSIGAAISLIIFGAATFALVPPLQMRVMSVAHEAPGLASSVNIGAFNLGNALGAALGGAVISLNMGYAAVPVSGAVLAALTLVLVLVQKRLYQHDHPATCEAAS